MPCSSSAVSFMFVQSHWLHVGLLDCTDYIFRPYQTFGIASIPLRTKICLCKLLDVSRSACSYRAIQSLSPAWYTSPFTQSPKCLPFNADCASITQFSFLSHARYNTFIDLLVSLFSNIGCISLSLSIFCYLALCSCTRPYLLLRLDLAKPPTYALSQKTSSEVPFLQMLGGKIPPLLSLNVPSRALQASNLLSHYRCLSKPSSVVSSRIARNSASANRIPTANNA